MGAQEKALRLSLTHARDTFDAAKANEAVKKARKGVPSLLPSAPAEGLGQRPTFDLANPLGKPLSVERDPYARPLGQDVLSDVTDFVGGATFMDGLAPDASTAATLGMGATLGTPGMLAKTGRGVYSRLLEGFRSSLPVTVKAESVRNLAKKTGASDEELVWSKLEEFLSDKPAGTRVDRDELIAHVEANTPKIEAKVLGEPIDGNQQKELRRIFNEFSPNDPQRAADVEADFYRRQGGAVAQPTKYKQQTLPGGENYRETLIRLDNQPPPISDADVKAFMPEFLQSVNIDVNDPAVQKIMARPEGMQVFHTEAKRVLANNRFSGKPPQFTGGHFDTPNVLTHIRHNDRQTPAGGKVRFLEEVQSDWHQKGKDDGYKPTNPVSYKDWLVKEKGFTPEHAQRQAQQPPHYDSYRAEWNAAQGKGVVPDAPFKDTWPDLALKQQLIDASEKGLDGVAWTPGKVQADRYNLAKHIQAVHYYPEGHLLRAQNHGGVTVIDEKVEPGRLADYIGKEAAERLLRTPMRASSAPENAGSGFHALENESLQIGGEGMTEFYDKLLPKRMEKLLKGFGGRVEQSRIDLPGADKDTGYNPETGGWDGGTPGVNAWLARLTPEIRQQILTKGFPLALYMALMGQQQNSDGPAAQTALGGALGRQ